MHVSQNPWKPYCAACKLTVSYYCIDPGEASSLPSLPPADDGTEHASGPTILNEKSTLNTPPI